jgi:hypothetical protein
MNDAGPPHPTTWRISAQWIQGQQQPQSAPSQPGQSPWLISPQWIERRDIRKEYREERETEMAADLEAAKIGENSAVALAQTVIKSGFILNGGGIIAIPAVVALFNLDAERLLPPLILTAGLFVGGLCSASTASICAFFALAHKADSFYTNAVHTARVLQGKYFPPKAQEMAKQAEAARRRAARLRVWWITERYVAIFLCVASVALFIGGAWVGGNAILKAPHKATQINMISVTAPPCKDGSQTCQPWERDWSKSELKPGSVVNGKGAIAQPPITKP